MGCSTSKSNDVAFDAVDGLTASSLLADTADGGARNTNAGATTIDPRARAAMTIQAVNRGRTARAKVELMKHPCDHYQLDTTAENFGDCCCGWPKAAHAAEAFLNQGTRKREMRECI